MYVTVPCKYLKQVVKDVNYIFLKITQFILTDTFANANVISVYD